MEKQELPVVTNPFLPVGPLMASYHGDPSAHMARILNEILYKDSSALEKLINFRVEIDSSIESIDEDSLVMGFRDNKISISALSMINTVLLICGHKRICALGPPNEDRSSLLFIASFEPLEETSETIMEAP